MAAIEDELRPAESRSVSSRTEEIRRAKAALRRELTARRLAVGSEAAARAADRVCELICETPEFAAARTVALYAALRGELPTRSLFEAVRAAGKRALLPRVESEEQLAFLPVDNWSSLRKGRFGVLEPALEVSAVSLAEADLVILPGVGFTPDGDRLGHGKGHYDRSLGSVGEASILFGACFSCQLVDDLPREPHDRRVHAVVTETGMIRVPAPRAGEEERE